MRRWRELNILTRSYLFCGESSRKVLSMLVLGIFRLNGRREEVEIWCGASPELKKGFVSYEVLRSEGKRFVPISESEVARCVAKVLHGPEDPKELSFIFRLSLNYYYFREGRTVYLKRDLYELKLRGLEGGALISLRFIKGMSRMGYDEVVERIAEKAKEVSLGSKLIYASYPDELDSCK